MSLLLRMPWLVSESSKNKAKITYELRILEVRFFTIIKLTEDSQLIEIYCKNILQMYKKLLLENTSISMGLLSKSETNFKNCIDKIKQLRKKMRTILSIKARNEIIFSLLFCYENLLKINLAKKISNRDELSWHALFAKKNWFEKFIDIVMQYKENPIPIINDLHAMDRHEILNLHAIFYDNKIMEVFNALAYYKNTPLALLTEEEVNQRNDVVSKLTQLHQFVKMLYHESRSRLLSFGLSPSPDYLLDGDELPAGIHFTISNNSKKIIKKFLVSIDFTFQPPNEIEQLVNEIFRSYKHWFNPIRFIDASITLYYRLTGQSHIRLNDGDFSDALKILYDQLPTSICLDLYGYFSNKDTRYLKHSLLAASQGKEIVGFNPCDDQGKLLFSLVHSIVDSIINILFLEMENRNFSLQKERKIFKKKLIKPGKRNLQALMHIINIYLYDISYQNGKLEGLFKAMEAKNRHEGS